MVKRDVNAVRGLPVRPEYGDGQGHYQLSVNGDLQLIFSGAASVYRFWRGYSGLRRSW